MHKWPRPFIPLGELDDVHEQKSSLIDEIEITAGGREGTPQRQLWLESV